MIMASETLPEVLLKRLVACQSGMLRLLGDGIKKSDLFYYSFIVAPISFEHQEYC